MSFTHQITNIGWKAPKNGFAFPYLTLKDLETGEEKPLPLENYNFQWLLSAERHCTGWWDTLSSEMHPCPYDNVIDGSSNQCGYCEKRTGFKSAFFFNQEPNANMQKYLAQTHYIYLAYFQPQTIKVGTEAEVRKSIRLIEQDALIGLLIAEADGFNITKIERAISTQLGYTETINSKQKFQFLTHKPSLELATQLITSAYQRIYHHFQNTEFKEWLYKYETNDIPESLIDHSNNPNIFYPDPAKKLNKIYEYVHLTGKFLGLRHKYLILEWNDAYVVFNKRYLEGRYIEVTSQNLEYDIKSPSSQLNLFG